MLSSQVTFSRGNFPNVSTNFPSPFPRTSFHSIPDGVVVEKFQSATVSTTMSQLLHSEFVSPYFPPSFSYSDEEEFLGARGGKAKVGKKGNVGASVTFIRH